MNLFQSIPKAERPRERLTRYGSDAVSTVELLAIVLGSGTKSCSVLELAGQILSHFGSLKNLANATLRELMAVKGIGPAKALQLQAAFSLLRRFQQEPERLPLRNPEAVYALIRSELEEAPTEQLLIVLRDTKRRLLHREIVSTGTLTELLIHPREVFHAAIRHRAHSAIIAHNHPSGDPTPSFRDLEMTKLLASAGRVVGIELVDHLIIGKNSYISLFEKGVFKRTVY